MELLLIPVFLLLLVGSLALYLLPWIVAAVRGHHQLVAIAVLNVLAGWTFFGWVGALVWACTEVRRSKRGEP
jgi:hypothetical protein